MLKEVTKYKKVSNSHYKCRIKALWLILTVIILGNSLISCTNMRSVRAKETLSIAKQADNRTIRADNKSVNSEMSDFEEYLNQIENNSNNRNFVNSNSNDDESDNPIISSGRRLPTLREQMLKMTETQDDIANQVNSLQKDVYEIKVAVKDIKNALNSSQPVSQASAIKGEPQRTDFNSQKQVNHSNNSDDFIILPDEKAKSKPNTSANKPVNNRQNNATKKSNVTNVSSVEQTSTIATTAFETKPVTVESNVTDNKDIAIEEPSSELTLADALQVFANRNYNTAIEQLHKIAKSSNDKETISNCNYWIGESYYGLGNYDQAISFFRKVLNQPNAPKSSDAQIMIAESHIRAGKPNEARQAFQELINQFPRSKFVPRARKMLQQL